MKSLEHGAKVFFCLAAWGAGMLAGGCNMAPSHTMSVDAITDGPARFSGVSYRLVARDPVLMREVLQYNLATTCVTAALAGKGMFVPADNVPPELLVEVDYGEAPMLVLPGMPRLHELYLQLSARKYRADAPARNFKGEEVWNVRVSLKDPNPALERMLPLLAAVATDYAGQDHQPDSAIEVADTAPTVVAVKNAVVGGGAGIKPGSPGS